MKTNYFLPVPLFFAMVILMGCPKPTQPPLSELGKDKENTFPPISEIGKDVKPDICNNNIKDDGEEGIDCGGNCDEDCKDVLIFNELLIRHLKVVDSEMAKTGDLSFGKLMERLSPSTEGATDLIFSLINSWLKPREVNGFIVPARPVVSEKIIRMWKENQGLEPDFPTAEWQPNLKDAPFRLLAITNRVDLQELD